MSVPKYYQSLISGPRTSSKFDSSIYFKDVEFFDSSAIGRFMHQRELLVKILGKEEETETWRLTANLVIIGIVSAVESYFRAMIRGVLIIDKGSRIKSYKNKVSYGAALFHASHLLPEALLEDSTFVSGVSIPKNLKSFLELDVNLQQKPEIDAVLKEYEKVCQLRHCIAHRSGLLGSKNAIELGLDSFSNHLEKPISLSLDSVNNVFNICHNLVLEFNDYIFEKIMAGTVHKEDWSGDLRKDKRKFLPFFTLFSPKPEDTEELKQQYYKFIEFFGIK